MLFSQLFLYNFIHTTISIAFMERTIYMRILLYKPKFFYCHLGCNVPKKCSCFKFLGNIHSHKFQYFLQTSNIMFIANISLI